MRKALRSGDMMATSDGFCLAAAIVMAFPMAYFLIVSPNFFFFKFSDPVVSWVLRGLFNTYFLATGFCFALGAVVFALAGKPPATVGAGVIGALAFGARRWFLQQIDAQIRARDAGDAGAPSQLRRLQVGGMLYNTVQLVAVVASIPLLFGTAT